MTVHNYVHKFTHQSMACSNCVCRLLSTLLHRTVFFRKKTRTFLMFWNVEKPSISVGRLDRSVTLSRTKMRHIPILYLELFLATSQQSTQSLKSIRVTCEASSSRLLVQLDAPHLGGRSNQYHSTTSIFCSLHTDLTRICTQCYEGKYGRQ